jgi:hypothetical protein
VLPGSSSAVVDRVVGWGRKGQWRRQHGSSDDETERFFSKSKLLKANYLAVTDSSPFATFVAFGKGVVTSIN